MNDKVKDFPKTVTIVDDDPAVLDSLKFLLGLSGYDVGIYNSATEFLKDSPSRSACLILDQHMPQMTGLELAAHLRHGGNFLPILLITGAPTAAIIARAAKLGIEKVMEKPPNHEELLSFLEAHA